MNWLDSVSINLLNKDLDCLWARQKSVSDNIANIETPGYKSKTINFENQLKELIDSQSAHKSQTIQQIKNVNPVMTISDNKTLTADGNNVDMEKENIMLARTQLNYLYSLQELSDHFSRLRCAIIGRK